MKPTRKVSAGVLAGAATTILLYVLHAAAGVDPPAEIGAAASTLIGGAIAWWVPEND